MPHPACTAGMTRCAAWAVMRLAVAGVHRITERTIYADRGAKYCRIQNGSEAVAAPRISRAAPGPESVTIGGGVTVITRAFTERSRR